MKPIQDNANSNAAAASSVNPMTMSIGDSTDYGNVKIHDNVIAALVSRAVLSIEGVTRLAGSALIDTIVGLAGNHSRAINITKSGENSDQLTIDVKINVAFGAKIPAIAPLVQRAIIEQVEAATGITVDKVNLMIQMLEDPADVPHEEQSDEAAQAAAMQLPMV